MLWRDRIMWGLVAGGFAVTAISYFVGIGTGESNWLYVTAIGLAMECAALPARFAFDVIQPVVPYRGAW